MGKGSRNRAAETKPAAAQATTKTNLGIKLAFIGVAVLALVALVYFIITSTGMLQRNTVAMTVKGEKDSEEFSAAYMDILYYNVRNEIVSQNYYYLYMYGYPLNSGLDAMPCIFDNSVTFREYFISQAKMQALEMMVLHMEGEKAGFQPKDADGWQEMYQELKDVAKENNMSVKEYIKAAYGNALNEETLTEYYKFNYYSGQYYEHVFNKEYTQTQKDDFYKKNANDYDVFDMYVYAFNYKTYTYTAPKEGETVKDGEPKSKEEAEKMSKDAKEAAKADADAFLKRLQAGEAFDVIAKEYFDAKAKAEAKEGEEPAKFETALQDDQKLTDYASVLQTWLKHASREVGDQEVIADDSNRTYYVVKFEQRQVNPAKAATVRHILLGYKELKEIPESATAEEKAKLQKENAEIEKYNKEQKAKAEKLLKDWKAGKADEDSFEALVKDNSEDTGSVNNGGKYEKFEQGSMVDAFDKWCFDEARKYGDSDLVETEYGVHMMFFVSADGDYYQHVLLQDMRDADYSEWYKEAGKGYTAEYNNFGMSLINN